MQLEHDRLAGEVEGTGRLLASCERGHERLSAGLKKRKRAFRELRAQTEESISTRFNKFLRRRRMQGTIAINYSERTLDMRARPCVAAAWRLLVASMRCYEQHWLLEPPTTAGTQHGTMGTAPVAQGLQHDSQYWRGLGRWFLRQSTGRAGPVQPMSASHLLLKR